MVRYLTRYLTGGPISDLRIVAADTEHVTFLAREGKQVGGEREQVPVTIPTLEFMRRWCAHIQPEQLTKTRYFAGWCSCKRTEYQANCHRLLGLRLTETDEVAECEPTSSATAPTAGDSLDQGSRLKCPVCESHSLSLTGQIAKPAWSSVLTHSDSRCPGW